MSLSSFVYQRYIRSGRMGRKIWSLPRKILVKLFGDPTCTLPVHGRRLQMHLSHCLPGYLQDFPCYDRLPGRLSQFVKRKSNQLTVIDVGANIGDTIAAFYTEASDRFLAIEPDPRFRKLLESNWGSNPNVTILSDLCSSESLQGTYKIQEKNGTASLVPSSDGMAMRSRTLDDIIHEHSFAQNADILKVDTDGHDFKVLAGAKGLVARQRPIVLFECAPFRNPNYVQDTIRTLGDFRAAGYSQCVFYNNLGDLIGKFGLSDLSPIKNLLFFQILTDSLYYDVLLMPDEELETFYAHEVDFFTQRVSDPSLRETARTAISE